MVMSFMGGILEQNKPVWDKCIATLFVQDMNPRNLIFGIWLTRGKGHEGEDLLCGRRW